MVVLQVGVQVIEVITHTLVLMAIRAPPMSRSMRIQ